MQIMIEIPNEEVPNKQEIIDISLHFIAGEVCECSYPYIVLPKGHGRLIDADYLKDVTLIHNNRVTNKYFVPYKDRNGYRMRDREVVEALINAETIIEADGGGI